jgi:hypothetical protein
MERREDRLGGLDDGFGDRVVVDRCFLDLGAGLKLFNPNDSICSWFLILLRRTFSKYEFGFSFAIFSE